MFRRCKYDMAWLKWKVAKFLDRNPDRCWGMLCIWVQCRKWSDLRDMDFELQCNGPSYYCGKCEETK